MPAGLPVVIYQCCYTLAEDVINGKLDHASGVARFGYVVCQDGGGVEGVGVVFKQV